VGHNNGPCCDPTSRNNPITIEQVGFDFAPCPFGTNHFWHGSFHKTNIEPLFLVGSEMKPHVVMFENLSMVIWAFA
jgi:hypothetical protein